MALQDNLFNTNFNLNSNDNDRQLTFEERDDNHEHNTANNKRHTFIRDDNLNLDDFDNSINNNNNSDNINDKGA